MTEPTPLWRRLLAGWMAIAEHFGSAQTLVLLGFIYVFVIGPVSLVQAIARRDQLDKHTLRDAGTAWHASESGGNDLERAKLLS
jgi:hypothetical protein